MAKYTVVYTEVKYMDVDADSAEKAAELFLSGEIDYSTAECHEFTIDEVYEAK